MNGKILLKPNHRTPTTPSSMSSYQSSSKSQHTYTKLIESYTNNESLCKGKQLHTLLITTGLARLTHFATKLISFYVQCKQLSVARWLFDGMPHSNIHRWVALIGACSRNGFYQEGLDVFLEMRKIGSRHDVFVIPSVLKACGGLCDVKNGRVLHSVALKSAFELDAFVVSALIDMYCKCGEVGIARRVFDEMVGKDLVALNAIVSGYVQCGEVEEAIFLVEETRLLGVEPNLVTWNTLISGYAQMGDEVMVSKLFDLMICDGVEPDVVSWTSVISGLVQSFRNEAAFSAFRQMLQSGFYPSHVTISGLLPACASTAHVRRGKEIHGYAVVIGVERHLYVSSALVDVYAKSGFLSEARMLFCKMPEKNTVTWNSMIFGYANHGLCNEAIELFHHMEKFEGTKPNHLTFTATLTACSHAGLVKLGESLFLSMQEKYSIAPRLEHYACMVDLLGKAGKLTEAYSMITSMPIEPDVFVWGALLGACRNHGDIDLAEIAARNLAKLEPGNAGNSKLLSTLYANSGSWGNLASFKETMKRKKLRKFTGFSWLEAA